MGSSTSPATGLLSVHVNCRLDNLLQLGMVPPGPATKQTWQPGLLPSGFAPQGGPIVEAALPPPVTAHSRKCIASWVQPRWLTGVLGPSIWPSRLQHSRPEDPAAHALLLAVLHPFLPKVTCL